MININSLMLGDWVTSKKWREKSFQLTRINDGGKCYYGITAEGSQAGPFLIEELEPIPLTAEILEKNGWRQYSPYFSNNNADFELEPYRDGGFGIRVLADEYGSGTFACIKYVHQLQHALRLCGIEKEIEL